MGSFHLVCTTVGSQAGALKFQCLHLFFQGDDSLSAITFDSDFETVSVTKAAADSRAGCFAVAHVTQTRALGHSPRVLSLELEYKPHVLLST